MQTDPLLLIEGLQIDLGRVPVVLDVSLQIAAGEMVGLVGESGCGKSVTALSIMRLLAEPPMRISAGRIVYAGSDMLALGDAELEDVRGNDLAMIFQEPMTSLNPVLCIGDQIMEVLFLHRRISKQAAVAQATQLLSRVGIASPEAAIVRYPRDGSGL